MTTPAMARSASETKPSAVVVGAGIAGLAAAFYLAQRGFQVTVYEKEKTAGGNLGATLAPPTQTRAADLNNVFEVYPHMFGDWYNNFWLLMEAIDRGKDNTEIWRAMTEFKFLSKPQSQEKILRPSYKTLRNNGALLSLWSNLLSGIIPLPDMILAGYAALGLLADDFKDTDELNVATLNDFLNTRFYGSRYVTQFYQMIILYIWSLEPDESSIYACQRFFQFQFRQPSPSAWVLNSGDAYTSIIQPLVRHLQDKLQVKFHFDTPVVAASLNQEKSSVEQLLIIENRSQKPRYKPIPKNPAKTQANLYVFAVPPETLAALVQTPIPSNLPRAGSRAEAPIGVAVNKFGIITEFMLDPLPVPAAPSSSPETDLFTEEMSVDADGVTIVDSASSADASSARAIDYSLALSLPIRPAIVDAIPDLATTKTLSAEPIPVLYIGFKKGAEITNLIPKRCYVGLTESNYALTFVDVTDEFKLANPQLASSARPVETILALAASDYGELPIFQTPPAHIDFPGSRLSVPSAEKQTLEDKSRALLLAEAKQYLPFNDDDIVWCFFRTNTNHRLFLNDVDSARNPVKTVYRCRQTSRPIIHNLAFAGDFCSQDVVMSTVEAAVESGIRAAMQLADDDTNLHQRPPSPPAAGTTSSSQGRQREGGVEKLTLQGHRTYPKVFVASLKLTLMPYAVLAKSWSDLNVCIEETCQASADPERLRQEVLPQLLTYWPRQASMCLGAYQDALKSLTSLASESVIGSSELFWSFFNRR
jgi:uncharacterized protein with NAD-binding domain and iron-sulfur cluster